MDQGLTQLLPLVLIGVVFYFLLIRPQQKRAKQHRAMIDAVRRGDNVVTAGGIMGKVTKVRGCAGCPYRCGEIDPDRCQGQG